LTWVAPDWLCALNGFFMSDDKDAAPQLDPSGFNELRMCRSGPMLYNKFDVYVGGLLRKYREFCVFEQEVFQQFVRNGALVVEVGANIGGHTVELSRLVGPDGEVHAFEPQRIVFQTLCANLALNQCINVYARQMALGAESGTILVPALDPAVRENFGGLSLRHVSSGEPVPLFTLDNLDLPACHALKADVEGMEVEVLKGATWTIDTYRPFMYLENDREERSQELLTLLLNLDYAVYWHTPPLYNAANFAGETEDIFPGVVSINVLCVPNEAKITVNGLRRVASPSESWRE
jgi:FkbM family methyltransferase